MHWSPSEAPEQETGSLTRSGASGARRRGAGRGRWRLSGPVGGVKMGPGRLVAHVRSLRDNSQSGARARNAGGCTSYREFCCTVVISGGDAYPRCLACFAPLSTKANDTVEAGGDGKRCGCGSVGADASATCACNWLTG